MFDRSALIKSAAWLLVAAVSASHSLDAAEKAPLTLTGAIERALARNPELQGFQYRLRAQEARTREASLGPPIELRTELENAFGTGRTSGIDAAEATFSLSKVIELGGQRARRQQAAQAVHEVIQVERQAAQLDVLAEVTRRFIHVASDQERLLLTKQATELAERAVGTVQDRVSAARAPEVELRRARISLARARVEQEHAEHELQSSRRKLAAMWAEREADYAAVTAELYRLPKPIEFGSLAERLDRNPDFLRFASERRLRDAELRLAEARARGQLTIDAGVRRLQATQDQALVLGFSVPMFTRSRAQPAIEEANAKLGLTDAEREAHYVRAHAQLFEIYQELRHSITEAEVLSTQVLPEMRTVLEATEYAFTRGRYGYVELLDAQRELVSVRRALIEAASNAHLFSAEIERLTGEPLAEVP